jgi:hypothetical protein
MYSRTLSYTLGLFALIQFLVIETGCVNQAVIPSAAQDRAPVVALTSYPSGGGNTNPETIHTSQTVWVDLGTHVMVMGSAHNPGGVKSMSLRVIQGGNTLYSVQASADASQGPPDALYILGSNGKGQAGSAVALIFTETWSAATAELTATNFNGMMTSVLATYVCANCQTGPSVPGIGGGGGGGGQTKCGAGPACASGSICCAGRCVVNDPQNCGACGVICPAGVCSGQQCATPGGPACSMPGEACVPPSIAGSHCCSGAVCNYQICRACTSHSNVCPSFGSQICCDPNDQCVLDPGDGRVKCGIPDCAGPNCPGH